MLFKAENLHKSFIVREGTFGRKSIVSALDGFDIFVREGQTTALVGESGCGKTTLAKVMLGFYDLDSGKVNFLGRSITPIKKHENVIRKNMQIVFQNPFLSMDPRYTVYGALQEALTVSQKIEKKHLYGLIATALSDVELNSDFMNRYPHQLSGGQIQRVCIARALLKNPKLLFLDEPTSSLDISTTSKIIDLLIKLQKEHVLSYLFISHNLKIVRKISHTVFVMYRGKIMEYGPKKSIYEAAHHPYTQLLLKAAAYKLEETGDWRRAGGGCVFKERCGLRSDACDEAPPKKEVGDGHFVYCHKVS